MSPGGGSRESKERFFEVLVQAVLPLKAGPDPEVSLEALIDAAQMLVDHLQQELAGLRQERAE